MSSVQYKMDSVIGPLYVVASARGLRGIFWKPQPAPFVAEPAGTSPEASYLAQAITELTEYLAGEREAFEVPLDVAGTPFQAAVWEELRKIPYGETVSYKFIAEKLGTKGIRAVGTANGRNPLSIVVPCHRVIASNGGIGGYAGGLEIKRKLLALERRLDRRARS